MEHHDTCICQDPPRRALYVTASRYVVYQADRNCPYHFAQPVNYDEPGHRNPYEGTTP